MERRWGHQLRQCEVWGCRAVHVVAVRVSRLEHRGSGGQISKMPDFSA